MDHPTITRRSVLSVSAAALGCSVLAGCLEEAGLEGSSEETGSDDDSSDTDGSGTDDAGGDDSNDDGEDEADDDIKRAVSRLNKIAFALETVRDQLDDPASIEFDADEEHTRLEEARGYLDDAEAATDGDRQADVDALRTVADVLAVVVDAVGSFAETDLEAELAEVRAAMDERRLEDARTTLSERRDDVDATLERLRPSLETLAETDADRLAALEVDVDPIREGASKLAAVLESIAALTRGFEPILTASEHLFEGEAHLDETDLEGAAESFEAARESLDEAIDELEAGADGAPDATAGHFDAALCRAETLRDATDLFLAAVAAAQDLDRDTAESKREAAEETLAEAEKCG